MNSIKFPIRSLPKHNVIKKPHISSNIFSCKVNEQIYTHHGGDPSIGLYSIEAGWHYAVDNTKGLYIRTISSNTKFIDLYIKSINLPGVYDLDNDTLPRPMAYRCENYGCYKEIDCSGNLNSFITNSEYTGRIYIEDFSTRGIIAGTFEFTGFNKITEQTILITDGIFNVKI